MKFLMHLRSLLICTLIIIITHNSFASESIPISGPISSEFAGEGGIVAINSVVRVICPITKSSGTGFLHKSGKIITAQHVIDKCDNVVILTSKGELRHVKDIISDNVIDLALLTIDKSIMNKAFDIAMNDNVVIGLQVSTWGYPSGYGGFAPLLSVGYLSGIDHVQIKTGRRLRKLVVNAAFNLGNSGGPLLNIEKGEVIGVVSSKLAPIPDNIQNNLDILAKDKKQGIFTYTRTYSDGHKVSITEGQVVEEVLDYLRSQTQLVVGYAVLAKDILEFLRVNNIDP